MVTLSAPEPTTKSAMRRTVPPLQGKQTEIPVRPWHVVQCIVFFIGVLNASGVSAQCTAVQSEVRDYVLSVDSWRPLVPVARLIRSETLEKLAARPASKTSVFPWVTVGMSRSARGLRLLRTIRPPVDSAGRVAWALGLLASGDATASGTIASALAQGPSALRWEVASALAKMPQSRPRVLLYAAMRDEDERVRLVAAQTHVGLYSRQARRVLDQLMKGGGLVVRRRAAEALGDAGVRFRSVDLQAFPGPERLRLLRHQLYTDRPFRRPRSVASAKLNDGDGLARVRAWARWLEPSKSLAEVRRAITANRFSRVEGITALATIDAQEASPVVPAFQPEEMQEFLTLIAGLAGRDSSAPKVSRAAAERLAVPLRSWLHSGRETAAEKDLLMWMESIHPMVAVELARVRLRSSPGPGYIAAARVLASAGGSSDVPLLLTAAKKVPRAGTGWLLRAASLLCAQGAQPL
jgi:hypothetical protein